MCFPSALLVSLVLSTLAAPSVFGADAAPTVNFQAHRGGLHEVPENTLAAFYYAWRLGAIPEIDIQTTQDGTIVCLHDDTLKRTSNATAQANTSITELPLEDVQRYDVGAWFDPRFAGERVPTLKQVFDVLRRHKDYQAYLDLKGVDLDVLARLIEEYGVAGQLIFCHNKVESCQQLKAAIPSLRTMLWIGGDADAIWEKFQVAAANNFAALDQVQLHLNPVDDPEWPFALSQARLEEAIAVTTAAAIDLEVLPFTITCESLQKLVDLGISWYATDEPKVFRTCLKMDPPGVEFLTNGVTAHRGDSGNYPENTMAAIDSAIALGADWVEIDIFKTADDVIVVSHDATTERFADAILTVADSTLSQLQALDVATGLRREKGLPRELCPPATMPTLEQVLTRIQMQHGTRLSIQPKMAIVDETIALIRKLKAEAWVGFNDGDLAKMSRVKELAPEIPVFWDRFKESPLAEDLKTAQERGFEALVPHVGALNAEVVAMMKDGGVEVGAWTVNDEKTMAWILDMGVDRIYTDYPERLLAVKGR